MSSFISSACQPRHESEQIMTDFAFSGEKKSVICVIYSPFEKTIKTCILTFFQQNTKKDFKKELQWFCVQS